MKKALIILVMVLMAATTYNQTSRRTTDANATTQRTRTTTSSTTTTTRSPSSSANTNQNRQTPTNSQAARTSSQSNSNSSPAKHQTPERSNASGSNARATQSPSTNSPRTNDNSKVNSSPRTTNTPASTSTRTYSNPSNANSRSNTQVHQQNGNNSRPVEAHHYNNVNANSNAHRVYSSTRVYQGQHAPSYTHNDYHPMPKTYREVHYVYRAPVHYDIIWTRDMHRSYCEMYPSITWRYSTGYRIPSVSAYRADFYIGEVMNVYGQVSDVYYSPESDEYFLYIGPYYPYQDFTVVVPGWAARNYSYRPIGYFLNQDISVTGLITAYDGTPEIVVKRNFQVNVY